MNPMKPENAGEMKEVLESWKSEGKSYEWVLYVADKVWWDRNESV